MYPKSWLTYVTVLLLIIPVVGECCMPVVPVQPSHCSHPHDQKSQPNTCYWSQEGTLEVRAGTAQPLLLEARLASGVAGEFPTVDGIVSLHRNTYYNPPGLDLFLRTGALLI